MRRARLWAGLCAAIAVGLDCAAVRAECATDRVKLRGPDGQASFTVEIADTPAERSRGLMYRESLDQGAGMLFLYPEPRAVSFWMKNTAVPLDIMFIDAQGYVQKIAYRAHPFDETPLPGGDGIQYVLEVNAGRAAALGIAPGWEVSNPLLDQSKVDWRCAAP